MTDQRTEQPAYTRGQKLWWRVPGYAYGYARRVPVEVVEMSASGRRCLVRFEPKGSHLTDHRYLKLTKLESRDE